MMTVHSDVDCDQYCRLGRVARISKKRTAMLKRMKVLEKRIMRSESDRVVMCSRLAYERLFKKLMASFWWIPAWRLLIVHQ